MHPGALTHVSARIGDYLGALYRLRELGVEPRLSLVARELRARPAAVAKGLSQLSKRGLVEKRGTSYELTPSGLELAARVVRNHRVVERFLTDVMRSDPLGAHRLAHELEHVDGFAELADEYLGRPSVCPHGNPIPGRAVVEAVPLSRVGPGTYRVVRIGEVLGSLEWALGAGLRLNALVSVEGAAGGRLLARLGGRSLPIPLEVATFIFVVRG